MRSLNSRGSTFDTATRFGAQPELHGAEHESHASGGTGGLFFTRDGGNSHEVADTPPGARLVAASAQDYAISPFSNGSNFPMSEATLRRSHDAGAPFFIPSPLSPPPAPQMQFHRISSEASQQDYQDSDEMEDEYEEVGDYEDSEVASKVAFERAKAASSNRDYSVGYLSDPEILTARSGHSRRRGLRRKRIGNRHKAVYHQLHRDAEVRQLKLERMRKRSEKDMERQLAQWRMAESSKQWLRNQPGNLGNFLCFAYWSTLLFPVCVTGSTNALQQCSQTVLTQRSDCTTSIG